jgi:predicted MFS family arabinose efflux permease
VPAQHQREDEPIEGTETQDSGGQANTATEWPPLRRNRDFLAVLLGQGVSALGDAVSFTAVPLLVLRVTGSGAAVGLIGMLQFIPDLAFGLIAGAYVDRWDRRLVMLGADIGRGLLTALIPLSFLLGWPTMVVLLLVVVPINTLRVFFQAAYVAAVPNLVGRDRIAAGTSAFEGVSAFGYIAGPAIAGILAVAVGPATTLALDAASFLVSAATLLVVRRPLAEGRPEKLERALLREIREGIGFIVRRPALRLAVAFWSLYVVLFAAWPAVMLFYVTVDRGLAADAYGVVIAGYGAGGLAGSIIAARIIKRRLGGAILVGAAIAGGLTVVTATQAWLPVVFVLTVLAAIGDLFVVVGFVTLRATVTPDRLLGRVSGTTRTLSNTGQAVGYLAAGLLLDRLAGSGTLVLIGGAVLAAAGVFSLAAPLRDATSDVTTTRQI